MQKEIDSIYKSLQSIKSVSDLKPSKLLSFGDKILHGSYSDELIHSFLDLGHLPQINALFNRSKLQNKWADSLFCLINKSKYHTGILLQQRAGQYPNNPLFKTIKNDIPHIRGFIFSMPGALYKVQNSCSGRLPFLFIYCLTSLSGFPSGFRYLFFFL